MSGPRGSGTSARHIDRSAAAGVLMALIWGVFGAAQTRAQETPAYTDLTLSTSERAADLVSRMTLEEKAGQLVNDAPAIPHLGVREYNWWNEGLHGVAAAGEATVFPQAIGMAATWNEPLMRETPTSSPSSSGRTMWRTGTGWAAATGSAA